MFWKGFDKFLSSSWQAYCAARALWDGYGKGKRTKFIIGKPIWQVLLLLLEPRKIQKILQNLCQNANFGSQNAIKYHPGTPFSSQSAFGAKMGPPPSCIQVVFHRFWVPQEGSKTAKNQLKSVSKLDVFSKCLLEGLLKGLGCQIEAKTIQNNTKNWSKIDKSRPPKIQRFYKEKMKENSKEISFSNKNVENIETWKCWFFIGFYSIICISAFCTPCRNSSLHVRGEA